MSTDPTGARRLPTVLLSVGVVVGIVVSILVAGGAHSPAVAFQQTGHWVFNRSESSVVHVDSGTHQVDARVAVPGAGADPVFAVQDDKQGFLVGRKSITVFGKSTLTVDATLPTGQSEMPTGIEVVGGPYLVYRQAGTIVRLGVPPLSIQVGGPVSRPVSTDDGTVWLHRPDNGTLCALHQGVDALDCSVQTAPGAPGALTVVSGTPAFLDTAQDAIQAVVAASLSTAVHIGTDLPDGALVGDRDTQGRLPVVVIGPNRLVLVDSGGVPVGRAGGAPVTVDLGDGQFTSPVAADGVVAVIEQTHNRLVTFGIDGRALGAVDLPPGEGPASIARGEDGRIYVDDADGSVTHIVGSDGSVTSVKTGGVVSAVVAAAPDQASLIPPPPTQSPLRPRVGASPSLPDTTLPVVNQPGAAPVGVPAAPVFVQPPAVVPQPPPPGPPSAPDGVRAALGANGVVNVSWNAIDSAGQQVSYVVVANGGNAVTSTRTSVTFRGLTAGAGYSFIVTATTGGGTGPGSAPSNIVIIPVGPPGAPTNVKLAEAGQGARTKVIDMSWQRPALNGGDLVKYLVVATNSTGKQVLNTTSTTESIPTFPDDACLTPYRFEVRAVTRTPGSSDSVTGPPGSATSKPYDCSWVMAISAQATGPQLVSVQISQTNNVFAYASGPCSLQFNGKTMWTGECGGTKTPNTPAAVSGLTAATTYKIVLKSTQVDGSVTSSNIVTLTTPA